jgi:hypothetical protein
MVKRKVDGITRYVAADSVKAAKPTLESLTIEREKYRDFWQSSEREVQRLNKRIQQLEAALTAMSVVAEAAKSSSRYDDEIPF